MNKSLLCLMVLLALVGCGGSGGSSSNSNDSTGNSSQDTNSSSSGGGSSGGGGTIGGSNPPPQNTDSGGFSGLGSYRNFQLYYDPTQPYQYDFSLDIDGADENFNTAELTGLAKTSQGFNDRDGNFTLGSQNYQLLSLSCLSPSAQFNYDAVMLFDRSGSMSSNDPGDQSRQAGGLFIDNLGNSDRAAIYQFRGQNSVADPLTNLTSNTYDLVSAITYLRAFGGDTPLWDAMHTALNELQTGFNKPALLVFSDGEDTASSQQNAQSILDQALATGSAVYAINLRNANSDALDRIALATGGNIFSTDHANDLVAYYGFLGNILAGTSIKCSAALRVTFTPSAGINQAIGFGPAGKTKTDFVFNASANGDSGTVKTNVSLPLYPGRQVGTSVSGVPIYYTDISDPSSNRSSDCIDTSGGSIRNQCTNNSIYVRACNSTQCTGGVVTPGNSLVSPAGNFNYTSCWWLEGVKKFIPAIRSGDFPLATFRIWDTPGTQFNCVYAGRL